jgi:MFS superfamily sulfate permease-like transporter
MEKSKNFDFRFLKEDFQAGLVVFLVALPLCLGIALASGVPLFSGIIAGVIGGIIVGSISGSQVSVSGPAAGLVAIIISANASLDAFRTLSLAIMIGGIIQIFLGYLKAGSISSYFPSNVIEGMLAAIGLIIIIKQIPVGFGIHPENKGIFITISEETLGYGIAHLHYLTHIHFGSVIILVFGIALQLFWDKYKKLYKIQTIPSALIAVIFCTILNESFLFFDSIFALDQEFLVNLPDFSEMKTLLTLPNFSEILNPKVWKVAITIAIVASVETLLSIDATDKMDSQKRLTDTNRELKAQGVGNFISGFLGGLPLTSVIVRSSANINAGGRSKISTIIHGILLLLSVFLIPKLLNKIPLASLASILFLVGYRLCSPKVFLHIWRTGKSQFLPFIITVLAVVFTDLLVGVAIGFFVSILFILRGNLELAYRFRKEQYHDGEVIVIHLAEEVSFLNKAAIKHTLMNLPENCTVIIDSTNNVYIDHDVIVIIKDFLLHGAKMKNINARIRGFRKKHKMEEFSLVTIE